MDDRKITSEILTIRLTEIRLLNVSYRITATEKSGSEESDISMSGTFGLSFSARRKHSFKLRARQEIKAEGATFRATHKARFISQNPLPKDIYADEGFQVHVMNSIMPFVSELFANLTGKSYTIPLIAPDRLPIIEENEDSQKNAL